MAKKSAVEKNKKRERLVEKYKARREALIEIIKNKETSPEDRFEATLKLAKLPRNSSSTRVRNRCALSGRPRGYYRKFGISRIELRNRANQGEVPGVVKSSW